MPEREEAEPVTERFTMGLVELSGEERALGPYRLLGQLATGGMGLIYLGRDQRTGQLAALKTVLAPGGVSAEARRRFRREVELAGRVTSPRTVRVLASDADETRPWMAMEYIPAPSLEALVVRSGALADGAGVRGVGRGTAEALVELHRRKIVHRDVKPLNILLTRDGPKVIDFGISHAGDLTSTRLTLSTIAFAAPEQAEGESCTPASDVYSLGVTLYYIAAGHLPYPETVEPLQQLNYVRRAEIDLGGLPDGLAEPIGACLARSPGDRPTARELLDVLAGGTTVLPADWSTLIGTYEAEGRRLQNAGGLSEAETVVRDWTTPPTRVLTETPAGQRQPEKKPKKPKTPEKQQSSETQGPKTQGPKAVVRLTSRATVTVRVLSGGNALGALDPGESKDFPLAPGSRNLQVTAPDHQDAFRIYGLRRDQTLALEVSARKGQLYVERPGVTPRKATGGSGSNVSWQAAAGVTAFIIVVMAVILVVGTLIEDGAKHEDAKSSGTPPAVATTEPTDTATDDPTEDTTNDTTEDTTGDSEEPTSTPPSPEDEAFAAIAVDDCLSDRNGRDGDWTSDTPSVASCSDTGSYYRVVSVSDSGHCDSADLTRYHDNADGSETDLCLDRNYQPGQCMFAKRDSGRLHTYWNQVTGCHASFPDKYEYIVQVTRVFPNGAPDGACGSDRVWTPDNGGTFCGRPVWKRTELPSI
ncbi:serine/threonine protein kinase [Streptomyces sp. NPDC058045]|uniref:serine/threonine protein kinase n=1 Tax=Streptomyces sp. NPDC058045 TaxID=3346311 RepID=UPI0036F0A8E2